MIKVLTVATGLNRGGAELMLYRLLTTSDRKQFKHEVVTLIAEGAVAHRLREANLTVHSLGMRRSRPTLSGLAKMVDVIRGSQPDIIQGWMYHGSLVGQLASHLSLRRVPVLWNIRGDHTNLRAERPLTACTIWACARLSGLPQRIVSNSHTSLTAHQRLGFSRKTGVVIPNGFATDEFVPSKVARQRLRHELRLDEDTLLVGHVGRYHPVKDHHTFLNAAEQVLRHRTDVHFVLVGEGVTPNNKPLASLIEKLGLVHRTHLLGSRDDLEAINAGFDIATSTSRSEGFSNSVGEAMCCAVPCVVTDAGDSAWIVGDTGTVVPPGNPAEFAQALIRMIESGRVRMRELGDAARSRMIEKFSLAQAVDQYESLYRELAPQPSEASASYRPAL